jgi:GT2 family glycosyltransferase
MKLEALLAPCRIVNVTVSHPLWEASPGNERSMLAILWSDEHVPLGGLVLRGEEMRNAPERVRRAAAQLVPARTMAPASQASVSVVVCTRDRPTDLARCLDGLAASQHRPDEIIVVDNAPSTSAARDVVSIRPGVRYVLAPEPGLSRARNAGVANSAGELIVFTDDDAIVTPTWLERLVGPFADDGVEVVTGLVLPAELETPAQVVFERLGGFGRGFHRRDYGYDWYASHRRHGVPVWTFGAGASMGLRRSALDRVGGFDERLGPGAAGVSDDSEMWYRILASGGRCVYEPSAVVWHRHRREMAELQSQLYAYMRGHVTGLLVQHEVTGDKGNLWRLVVDLPKHYLLQSFLAAGHPRDPRARCLPAEITGCIAGVLYYFRTPRSPARWQTSA